MGKRRMNPVYVAGIILCVIGMLLSIIVPCVIDFLNNPNATTFNYSGLLYYLLIYFSGAGIFLWGDVHIGGELFSYGNVVFFMFLILLIAVMIMGIINKKKQ